MFTQLLIVAVVAMLALAILRVARVQRGLSPLPEGSRRTSFLVGFVVLPPMVLGAILQPPPGGAPLGGIFWLPVYLLILGALKLLMTIVAGLLEGMTKGRTRRLLLIALVGNEGDPDDLPFNPPVTPRLAERMALVDRTNAAFPPFRTCGSPGRRGRARTSSSTGRTPRFRAEPPSRPRSSEPTSTPRGTPSTTRRGVSRRRSPMTGSSASASPPRRPPRPTTPGAASWCCAGSPTAEVSRRSRPEAASLAGSLISRP